MNESVTLTPTVSERDHAQGPAEAPMTLVEYGDYQCPYCGEAYPVVKRLQKELGKRLRFIFRNFPLTQAHPYAMVAAEAARPHTGRTVTASLMPQPATIEDNAIPSTHRRTFTHRTIAPLPDPFKCSSLRPLLRAERPPVKNDRLEASAMARRRRRTLARCPGGRRSSPSACCSWRARAPAGRELH